MLRNFIGEWIEELEDGFENGRDDVITFFKQNISIMLEVAGGPAMGGMISMMGTGQVLNFV